MTASTGPASPGPQQPTVANRNRAEPARRSEVSPLTVNRLSIYLRSLRTLEARGVTRISSHELAREFHLSPTQIRKDLSEFGEFGVRGIGYDVAGLAGKLSDLLRLGRMHPVVIVGMGNLGMALARFPAFNSESFQVVAGFDSDPSKAGRRVGRVPIYPMSQLARIVPETSARMAILAVPEPAAGQAFDTLVRAGIASILNFAPTSLPSSPECRVKSVDLRIHLEELAFFVDEPAR